jgi:hypothetical protein
MNERQYVKMKRWLNLNELNGDEDKIQEIETSNCFSCGTVSLRHIGDVA